MSADLAQDRVEMVRLLRPKKVCVARRLAAAFDSSSEHPRDGTLFAHRSSEYRFDLRIRSTEQLPIRLSTYHDMKEWKRSSQASPAISIHLIEAARVRSRGGHTFRRVFARSPAHPREAPDSGFCKEARDWFARLVNAIDQNVRSLHRS